MASAETTAKCKSSICGMVDSEDGYMEDERDATSKLTVKSWFAIDTD